MPKKRVLICGSTGSIGSQALAVISAFPELYRVVFLSAGQNLARFREQLKIFQPVAAAIADTRVIPELQQDFPGIRFYKADEQAQVITSLKGEFLLLAVTGEQGIPLARAGLHSGKHLLLATKEVIVAAGEEIVTLAAAQKREIRPIDSEHSAIWQALRSGSLKEIRKIWLTCSGGPFLDAQAWPLSRLKMVTPAEAVRHPNWSMGKKISVDSATLMNKALEVIEAVYLFGVSPEQVEVVIHPQSALHSAVEFIDGSIIGQIGTADMRTPIAYALSAPVRHPLPFPAFDFFGQNWGFQKVDNERFPSIDLAQKALRLHRCAAFNRANEQAVADFLAGKCGFLEIFERVKASLN